MGSVIACREHQVSLILISQFNGLVVTQLHVYHFIVLIGLIFLLLNFRSKPLLLLLLFIILIHEGLIFLLIHFHFIILFFFSSGHTLNSRIQGSCSNSCNVIILFSFLFFWQRSIRFII